MMCLGGKGHNLEGFSQQAITNVAIACMFLPVHAHVCSTDVVCQLFLDGPRWLISPILSYPIPQHYWWFGFEYWTPEAF